jgi:hypothetical protein
MEILSALIIAAGPMILSAIIGVLVPRILDYLRVQHTDALNNFIQGVSSRAAGAGYQVLLHGGSREDAIRAGLNYVFARIPETLAQSGLTAKDVEEFVNAHLGQLLAKDPKKPAIPLPQSPLADAVSTSSRVAATL